MQMVEMIFSEGVCLSSVLQPRCRKQMHFPTGGFRQKSIPLVANTEKATNPRKNERGENSVPWFDRDKMAYFHSSRIFDEDGLARIEIGSGRRIDEGIAPHKRKKRPSFSGGTPAFRLLARLTKA